MSLDELHAAWEQSDRLFALLAPAAWTAQPIPLRQPFVFYLGHLPAFAWNHLGHGWLSQAGPASGFDALFARGIDPVGVDAYVPAAEWPPLDAILDYRDRVRAALAESDRSDDDDGVLAMVVEHELMHHETLLYMLQELEHGLKRRADGAAPVSRVTAASVRRTLQVPEGDVVLGVRPGSLAFAWDNELPENRVHVGGFTIDSLPVTNAELLDFVRDGGYHEARHWRAADWAWRTRHSLEHPRSWVRDDDGFRQRTLFEDVPFDVAATWPAMTSQAEAAAYARWRGARLPSEAELRRAAWGAVPSPEDNLGFRHATPVPAGATPRSASAWGVQELIGNGWEWTDTPFGPLPGFEPLARYPGYSADFFDGRHFVLLGASWATHPRLTRPSFRNWFQPHYPYVFSKFRCVSGPATRP